MNNIDRKTLDKAREWAGDEKANWRTQSRNTRAAAEVIRSLPDSWVDADTLREALDWRDSKPSGDDYDGEFYDRLRALLPAPPAPRTLAAMTPEERAECQWMQATFTRTHHDHIITAVYGSKSRILRKADGASFEVANEDLVPHPDLPKLEWPGSEPEEAEDAATEPAPLRPEDVPVGEAWQVEVDGKEAIGYRNDTDDKIPWTAVYRDTAEHDWLYDSDVTLIARLVPETTEQNEEPDIDPDCIYTDRDGDKWEHIDGAWIAGDTHAERVHDRELSPGRDSLPEEYGPYTRITEEESDA